MQMFSLSAKRIYFSVLLLVSCMVCITPIFAASEFSKRSEQIGANVIFLRHALAPGYGDPKHFDILNCQTQRNLDQQGRIQARQIGQFLTQQDIKIDQLLSSRWCRCTETAALLGIGAFTTFDGLNSFFEAHVSRDETLEKLHQYLDGLPQDKIHLLVTHQVVISAITGISPPSGGFVLYNSQTKQALSSGL